MAKQKMNPVRNSTNEGISEGQRKKMISNGVKIPKSTRIYIRKEKARIRKSGVALEAERKLIDELYENLGFKHEH